MKSHEKLHTVPCEFYRHPKTVEGIKMAAESLKTAFKNLQKKYGTFSDANLTLFLHFSRKTSKSGFFFTEKTNFFFSLPRRAKDTTI